MPKALLYHLSRIAIVILWIVISILGTSAIALATDCDSKCEEHFDKWYQKPDLVRCQAEREASCRWGIEHCDFHSHNPSRVALTEIIQVAHNTKNDPQHADQCYRYVDGASLTYVIGDKGYQAYQLAQEVSSKFNPYVLVTVETAKQVLRCSCDAVDWGTDSTISNNSQRPILYVNRAHVGRETGTRGEPFKTVGLGYASAQSNAQLRIQSGSYPEQIVLAEPIVLIAEGGTVIIGK